MATAAVFGRKRLLLRDVDWRAYRHFLRMVQLRLGIHLTYAWVRQQTGLPGTQQP